VPLFAQVVAYQNSNYATIRLTQEQSIQFNWHVTVLLFCFRTSSSSAVPITNMFTTRLVMPLLSELSELTSKFVNPKALTLIVSGVFVFKKVIIMQINWN